MVRSARQPTEGLASVGMVCLTPGTPVTAVLGLPHAGPWLRFPCGRLCLWRAAQKGSVHHSHTSHSFGMPHLIPTHHTYALCPHVTLICHTHNHICHTHNHPHVSCPHSPSHITHVTPIITHVTPAHHVSCPHVTPTHHTCHTHNHPLVSWPHVTSMCDTCHVHLSYPHVMPMYHVHSSHPHVVRRGHLYEAGTSLRGLP